MQTRNMMQWLLVGGCLVSVIMPTSEIYANQIKCWTNEDGIMECGNVVPPQFTQQGHEVRNQQGLIIEQVKKAKTPEEIAREQAALLAQQQAEERKRKQAEEDRILLDLFGQQEDIEIAREARLNTIDAQIGSIDFYLNSLRKNLAEMEASLDNPNLSDTERKKIKQDIRGVKYRIRESEQNLTRKQQEKQEANQLYNDYTARFQAIQRRAAERQAE